MPAYDPSKDKIIETFGDSKKRAKKQNKKSFISFSLASYNEGLPKLRINRMGEKKDGTYYVSSLGGLTPQEVLFLKKKLKTLTKEKSFRKALRREIKDAG